jgi:hypothetical protein
MARRKRLNELRRPPEMVRSAQISPALWARHKQEIVRLYKEQGQSLGSVIETLREKYDFGATKQQYKRQFKKWGLEKYRRRTRDLDDEHDADEEEDGSEERRGDESNSPNRFVLPYHGLCQR